MAQEKAMQISRDPLFAEAKQLAEPIDFETLIKDGVLEKIGPRYRIKEWKRLPKHARTQISALGTDGTVIFREATESARMLVKQIHDAEE